MILLLQSSVNVTLIRSITVLCPFHISTSCPTAIDVGCTSGARSSPKGHLNSDQLRDLKSKSKCCKCAKYGHWARGHLPDGSLREDRGHTQAAIEKDATLHFSMSFLTTNSTDINKGSFGNVSNDDPVTDTVMEEADNPTDIMLYDYRDP